jgi:hypothetical protein
MEEQELKTKKDTKPISERQDEGTDEGTGMGPMWDIQRFRRLLERAKAEESASKT